MTLEEIKQFRETFRLILGINSKKVKLKKHLHNLHLWDKHDSHKNAIIASADELASLSKQLKEKLDGFTYEQWANTSKKINKLTSTIKTKEDQLMDLYETLNNLKIE